MVIRCKDNFQPGRRNYNDASRERIAEWREQEIDVIVDQYRRLAGSLNLLFEALAEKTKYKPWARNGVGSCGQGSPQQFKRNAFMCGNASTRLMEMWDEKRAQDVGQGKTLGPRDGRKNICKYHAQDEGCVLGDIKPAICLSFIENSYDELPLELYEEVSTLLYGLEFTLTSVMIGAAQWKPSDQLAFPERNEGFVNRKVERINALTKRVQALPALKN